MKLMKLATVLALLMLVSGCNGTPDSIAPAPQPGPPPATPENGQSSRRGLTPDVSVAMGTTGVGMALPTDYAPSPEEAYNFRIFNMQDFAEHLMGIYDIVEYYAGLDYQVNSGLLNKFPLTEGERKRSLEIIGYTEAEYKQLSADAISKDDLMWYVSMGVVEGGEGRLTDSSYPITRKGTYGHIPYVTINETEYCLILENLEEYDTFMHERYFQEIQYDLVDIAYSGEYNNVTAVVVSSLGSVYRVQLNFNEEGLIGRVDRVML